MTVKGRISHILPIEKAESHRGKWQKQQFVISTSDDDSFQHQICFVLWGEKIQENKLSLESEVEVNFNLSSREYNGRWYTEAKAWKVNIIKNAQTKDDMKEESDDFDFQFDDFAKKLQF